MPEKYKTIEGWFDEGFSKIYDLLVEEAKDGDIIVEVGCWKGCSSCYLLEKVQESKKQLKIYFFDSWADEENSHLGLMGRRLPEFLENLKRVGFERDVDFTATVMHGAEVPYQFKDNSVFAVMIDNNHAPAHVIKELTGWKLKAKILTFHDYPDENLKPVFDSLGNVEDFDSCGLWRNKALL